MYFTQSDQKKLMESRIETDGEIWLRYTPYKEMMGGEISISLCNDDFEELLETIDKLKPKWINNYIKTREVKKHGQRKED